jgi:hypothetical protein
MDLLRLEQTPKTSKCVLQKAGHKRGISKFMTGRRVEEGDMASDDNSGPGRGQQESITCKVTWDSSK